MFITNSSARAGATSSGPLCLPQAFTTAVKATSATAARLTQNAMSRGRTKTDPGTMTSAANSGGRQFDHDGFSQPPGWPASALNADMADVLHGTSRYAYQHRPAGGDHRSTGRAGYAISGY